MPQFIPTGQIGLPSDRDFVSTAVTIRHSITAWQIRRLIEAKCFVYPMPDMGKVLCVFTGEPIGDKVPFAFVRCRHGDKRIVLCLGSCRVGSRYEAITFEYHKAFNLFKIAIQNMATIDRSLFSLGEPREEHSFTPPTFPKKPKQRRAATQRRTKRTRLAIA
jgi:hypothetical protein